MIGKGKGDCFGCERERESGGLGFLWRPEAFVSASGGRRPRGGFWRRSRRLLRRQRRRRGVSSTEFKDVGYDSRFQSAISGTTVSNGVGFRCTDGFGSVIFPQRSLDGVCGREE